MIYSDDGGIRTIAAEAKIAVKGLADLPLPPENSPVELNLPMLTDRNLGELFVESQSPADTNQKG